MLSRSLTSVAAAIAAATVATPAAAQQAQDVQALRGSALAATCANCHGTQGQSVPDAAVPGLAGMPASYLVEQMRAFKAGTRPATVMHQISKGFDDAQIDTLAAYFAARPR